MKNSDYGNGPPEENKNGFDQQSGYPDSSSYINQQNNMDFQPNRVKSEPQSPKQYSQQFYPDGFQNGNSQYTFIPYNQETVSKMNQSNYRYHPYERPNSEQSQNNSTYLHNPTPSPSPKQCEKCGFICDSINQLTEHVNNCHPSTPLGNVTNYHNYHMLSGGEIIKTETELLDLDSYKVHQVLPEDESIRHQSQNIQPNQMMLNQWNQANDENIQPAIFNPNEQRMYPQQDVNVIRDQRMFSPNYFGSNEESNASHQSYSSQGFNMEGNAVNSVNNSVNNESPSPAKNTNWKVSDARKPKTYNCPACKKWFTSSGHLKRHYNTTLHKNAVKTSGLPDPANLPISVHHHPKDTQNRVDAQIPQNSPGDDIDRTQSPSEQYELPTLTPIQGINQQNYEEPPNVQADPSVMESRGLLSINNQMHINQPTHDTFNNINNGFHQDMLTQMDSPYYQIHPNGNSPHSSTDIIVNNTISEENKYGPLTSPNDNSQPLPSFSQIQRYSHIAYYGENESYTSYVLPNYPSHTTTYQTNQEENEERKFTMVAPPDSTSTDGDILPVTSSVNNNNFIVQDDGPIMPDIKYDMGDINYSSPETSIDLADVENSNPQISSTSNIVKSQSLPKCYDCDKVFNKSCYLTQHNKTFHSGDKPYKCVRCGKRFSCEQQHLEHQAKHGGEKPHKCDQCPKQFNHKTDLRRHMCLHTGKKPFNCSLCGKGFIRKDHMIKHGETHLKKPKSVSINQ